MVGKCFIVTLGLFTSNQYVALHYGHEYVADTQSSTSGGLRCAPKSFHASCVKCRASCVIRRTYLELMTMGVAYVSSGSHCHDN